MATWTKEQAEGRNAFQVEVAKITKRIAEFQEDPEAAIEKADVAPHLVGR